MEQENMRGKRRNVFLLLEPAFVWRFSDGHCCCWQTSWEADKELTSLQMMIPFLQHPVRKAVLIRNIAHYKAVHSKQKPLKMKILTVKLNSVTSPVCGTRKTCWQGDLKLTAVSDTAKPEELHPSFLSLSRFLQMWKTNQLWRLIEGLKILKNI